jgi:ERCC4-type nuclease
MELIVDDRERSVIVYLKKLINIKVERITVGDYAFVYNGRVVVIVERKSLTDLASSIKDGRMDNNDKLLNAQKNHGCQILYIIEGSAYPNIERKIGRMPYKCLQGKLDSLLFRNNIKIIWTRDCEHTAKRLTGLSITFTKMAKERVFGDFENQNKKSDTCLIEGSIITKDALEYCVESNINQVIKTKHEINLDQIHLKMLTKLTGVSYKTAIASLQKYTLIQILTGQTDQTICYNIVYIDSGFIMGSRGVKFHSICKKLNMLPLLQQKILVCINGITINTAVRILNVLKFTDIVLGNFNSGSIANIQQTEKRKIGKVIESRIRLVFSSPVLVEKVSDAVI